MILCETSQQLRKAMNERLKIERFFDKLVVYLYVDLRRVIERQSNLKKKRREEKYSNLREFSDSDSNWIFVV